MAACTDSAHIMSVALSLAAALQTGRSTLQGSLVRGRHALPYLPSGLAGFDNQPQDRSKKHTRIRPLRVHMEQVDILVGEEAQQDMDLKSAFVPAIPRQPFLRLLFGDPKQSPGGVADNLREHRALLLKARP